MAADGRECATNLSPGFGFQASDSIFRNDNGTLFNSPGYSPGLAGVGTTRTGERDYLPFRDGQQAADSPFTWTNDPQFDLVRLAAATNGSDTYPGSWSVSLPEEAPTPDPEITSNDRIFFKGWLLLTSVEVALLAITATMPKEWTGWSSTFVKDGWGNMKDAYTGPPVWDTDHWFHNYIGHPYGGSVYYNTVRCQGAKKGQSFLFNMALSVQWEYIFEAVAEQPSIQDLLITPIIGSLFGEFVHNLTITLKKHGTNFAEKVIITILNPTSVFFNGYK